MGKELVSNEIANYSYFACLLSELLATPATAGRKRTEAKPCCPLPR
jgi:hypothetical protein